MKKKLIKSLLPIASCVAIVAPIVCLTSCGKEEDVDEWDNKGYLVSDPLVIQPKSKRFRFEIEYEDWENQTTTWQQNPNGEFCLVPINPQDEYKYNFAVNQITFNTAPLSPEGGEYSISDDGKTIKINNYWTSAISSTTKIVIDVNVQTESMMRVHFAAK